MGAGAHRLCIERPRFRVIEAQWCALNVCNSLKVAKNQLCFDAVTRHELRLGFKYDYVTKVRHCDPSRLFLAVLEPMTNTCWSHSYSPVYLHLAIDAFGLQLRRGRRFGESGSLRSARVHATHGSQGTANDAMHHG